MIKFDPSNPELYLSSIDSTKEKLEDTEPITQNVELETKQPKESIFNKASTFGSKAIDYAKEVVPTTIGSLVGGSIGTALGGPAATIPAAGIGAGLTRIAQENIENIYNSSKKSQLNIIGEGVLDAALTIGGAKLMSAIQLKSASKGLAKAADEYATNQNFSTWNKYMLKAKNTLAIINRDLPENAKQEFVDKVALTYKKDFDMPMEMTRRLFERGPGNVLNAKNFFTFNKGSKIEEIPINLINNISKTYDVIMGRARQNYGKELKNVLSNKETINVSDIVTNFKDKVKNTVGEILKVKGKYIINPKDSVDLEASNFGLKDTLNAIARDLKDGLDVPIEKLHVFKQSLNKYTDSKAVAERPQIKKLIISLKDDVVNAINAKNPNYKKLNSEYKELIDLGDSLQGFSRKEKAMTLIHSYFKEDSSVVRDAIDNILNKGSKTTRQVWDKALDLETTRRFATNTGSVGGFDIGATLPVGPRGYQRSSFSLFQKQPRKEGLKLAQKGTEYVSSLQKGLRSGYETGRTLGLKELGLDIYNNKGE